MPKKLTILKETLKKNSEDEAFATGTYIIDNLVQEKLKTYKYEGVDLKEVLSRIISDIVANILYDLINE